jgi:pyrophosphatase PpaX
VRDTIGAMTDTPLNPTPPSAPLPPASARLKSAAAVLFDLDGTLIDTVELIRISFRHATEKVLGEAIPDEITMANVGQPLRQQFMDMAPDHVEKLLDVYRAFNRAHHDELACAYPGTLETVQRLSEAGVRMGVVTSKGAPTAMHGLDHFGLSQYFEVVVTADDVPVHKPDPYPLRFAAKKMLVPLEYCIYVGDSPHDMTAAINGSAVSVAALWGAFPSDVVLAPGPDYALDEIVQLPDLMNGGADAFSVKRGAAR